MCRFTTAIKSYAQNNDEILLSCFVKTSMYIWPCFQCLEPMFLLRVFPQYLNHILLLSNIFCHYYLLSVFLRQLFLSSQSFSFFLYYILSVFNLFHGKVYFYHVTETWVRHLLTWDMCDLLTSMSSLLCWQWAFRRILGYICMVAHTYVWNQILITTPNIVSNQLSIFPLGTLVIWN